MMNIIMPCGGAYKRFPPNMPKYLRPLNDMQPMFKWALNSVLNYPDSTRVFFGVRKEDEENAGVTALIKSYVRDVEVMVLPRETQGPADTVYEIIKRFNLFGRFIVKDCDCHMRPKRWPENNAVYVGWRETAIGDRGSKSWVITDNGFIKSIEEKGSPTDWYVHGCYQFTDTDKFIKTVDEIRATTISEIFCSHVIQKQIVQGTNFEWVECSETHDWGTWEKYIEWRRNRKVYFIDLDGTVFNAGNPYGKKQLWANTAPLAGVKDTIARLKEAGCTIIFTTSRPDYVSNETEKILKDSNIPYDKVVYGIPVGPRVLINDYETSNPYPSAVAINTKRNSGDWIEKI